jgi:hypothetical protein
MYLGLVLIVLAVLFAVVGLASGGAFTIVLVVLAAIAAVGAGVALLTARAAGITSTLAEPPHLPERGPGSSEAQPPPGEVPVTPDEYVEARQKTQ